MRALGDKVRGKEKVIVFNSNHPIEAMFYADCIAYSIVPDSSTISNIEKKGFTVYIKK